MKIYTLFFLGVLLSMVSYMSSGREAGALLDQAQKISWGVHNAQALNALIVSENDVRALLDDLIGDDLAVPVSSVSDYRIVDLNADGTLELIAAYDVSGRGFFNNISILWKRNNRIHEEGIGAWNVEDFSNIIVDIDGDGQMELVVPTNVEEYRGAEYIAVVPKIYKSLGAGYTEASGEFKDYYRDKVIPPVRQRLETARRAKQTGLVGHLEKELSEAQKLLNQ